MRRLLRLVILGAAPAGWARRGIDAAVAPLRRARAAGRRYDAAIVLSRGMDGAGGLDAGSLDRTDARRPACYQRASRASSLMTGDAIAGRGLGRGADARPGAVAQGVPPERVDDRIRSALHAAERALQPGFACRRDGPDRRGDRGLPPLARLGELRLGGRIAPTAICQSSPVAEARLPVVRHTCRARSRPGRRTSPAARSGRPPPCSAAKTACPTAFSNDRLSWRAPRRGDASRREEDRRCPLP